ncbi:TFIIB-type zinc ribbon-containing protein [Paraburkholderia sp. ZP32-5]|uniref:TFIIB-type zinc ribbon-containing protein n=1 Tax=Paraburkholderia sp. ZP32-5 TaxID=2883245 RepID=UPI001F31A6B7|nr:zf-TFIIB domain-containing protein [Paraburkholderia sp. ZP32-5]
MKCPVCKTTDLSMTERRSVEIDYCPDCRGVWLDRGELDKLIAQDMDDSRHPARAHENERHRHYDERRADQRGYRKKRSIFDMFDFD